MPTERHIKAYLILNWKDGSVRVLKRLPSLVSGIKSNLSLSDIPIKLDITLIIPEINEITLKGEVKLSQAQISNIAAAALEDE